MAATVQSIEVSGIEDIRLDPNLGYSGTAVMIVNSSLNGLIIKIPFHDQPSLDDAISFARSELRNFAISLQGAI